MQKRWMQGACLVGLFGTVACSPPPSVTDAGTDGGATIQEADAGGPPVTLAPTACATPTVTQGWVLEDDAGMNFRHVEVAAHAAHAAVFYTRSAFGNPMPLSIHMQRLDDSGNALGTETTLQPLTTITGSPELTVAANAEHFVACWNKPTPTCEAIPAGSGDVQPLSVPAGLETQLSVATRGARVYLAGLNGGSAQVVELTPGTSSIPVTVGPATHVRWVACAEGLALAYRTGNELKLQRFSAELAPHGSALTAHAPLVGSHLVAACSGGVVALGWKDNAQGTRILTVSSADAPSAPVTLDAPGATKPYGKKSIAPAQDGFALAWSTFEGFIHYRPVSLVGEAMGSAASKVVDTGWNDNWVGLAATQDGFVAATALGLSSNRLGVTRLTCP